MTAAQSLPVVPPLRASSLRDCPRKAVYEGLGTEGRDLYESEKRTMYRGKELGRMWTVMFAETNGLLVWVDSGPDYWVPPHLRATKREYAGVVAEKKIRWEYGVGHADAFVVETGSIIEVLSSAHASQEMLHSKILQDVLYIEHDADAKSGALVVVNPTDLAEEVYPIVTTTTAYAELVAEMRARIESVHRWSITGELPSRACGKPADARSHFCRLAEPCFADWTPPVLDTIEDEATVAYVADLYRLKQTERDAKFSLKVTETQRKEVEQRLEDLVPVGKHHVGGLALTRTHIDRQPTVDLRKATLAGFPVDSLAEFLKPGASYDTWRVDRVTDSPIEDFGEAPF